MPVGEYLVGVAMLLLLIASVTIIGWRLRIALLPAWSGPPAVLAASIASIASLMFLAQVLGTFGWFRRGPLVLACVLAAAGTVLSTRGRRARPGPAPRALPSGRAATTAAAVVVAAIAAEWSSRTLQALGHGVTEADSQAYHLTFAARFVQEGWLTRLHFAWVDPVWTFYAQNAELMQATAILPLHRDVLIPVLNLGWLALALLAGWCVGRPWGLAPLTLLSVAAIASLPVTALTQAGTAKNDIAILALWVAALALLVQVPGGAGPPLLFAGLAAGLALATKLTMIVPVGALTVAVIWLAPRGGRGRAVRWWGAPMVVAGAFWFARNLVRVGNPVPGLHIPGLPSPSLPVIDRYGFSVAHYLTDGHFWARTVPQGLGRAFGMGWPAILLVMAAAMVLGIIRGPGPLRAVGLVGVAGILAYVVTPLTASGSPDDPWLFWVNLRYLFPAMVVGLLMLPLLSMLRRGNRPRWVLGILLALCAVNLASALDWVRIFPGRHLGIALGVAAITLVAWFLAVRLPRRVVAMACAALLLGALAVGHRLEGRFEAGRYADQALGTWARTVEGARIGTVGVPIEYQLTGLDLSNRVEYIGHPAAHGSFITVPACEEFRAAVSAGRYDYVVTGPEKWHAEPALEGRWLRTDPDVTLVLNDGTYEVFRVTPGAPPVPC